ITMKNLKELLKRQQKLSSNEFKRRAKRFIKIKEQLKLVHLVALNNIVMSFIALTYLLKEIDV
ncbi:MAG: hypothetical protein ACTHLL_02265, partial [Candidatus Nitrosocosmicus sp.]